MNRKNYKRLMRSLAKSRLKEPRYKNDFQASDLKQIERQVSNLSNNYRRFSEDLYSIHESDISNDEIQYAQDVKQLLITARTTAEEIGIIDICEEYGDLIVEGMRFKDLPSEENEILRWLGEVYSEEVLFTIFMRVKHDQRFRGRYASKYGIHYFDSHDLSNRLKHVENLIEEKCSEQSENAPAKMSTAHEKKRWFKGLGKVAQGSALTLANVGLATSVITLPVSPTQQTWGAIVSSITGIGTIMHGVGELRGE